MMYEPNKIIATLKAVVIGEFYDDEASEETVRYLVEQDLEDVGFDVDVKLLKEQEPRTAHWFISEYEYLTCSHCRKSYYTGAESTEEARQRLADGECYKFCPHCGARMDAQAVKWDG